MKKLHSIYLFSILSFFLFSCSTPRNIIYFQDLKDTSKVYTQAITGTYEVQIQPDDLLEIIVHSINSEAAAPFNMGDANPAVTPANQISQGITNPKMPAVNTNNAAANEGYLVDKQGTIDFPVLGSIQVKGLTTPELKDTLKSRLNKYLQDPIVNVRLLNYKFTVLGEVQRPASYSIPSQRITIVDAIGMAGDLTIYGKRENVLLIREENGQRKFIRINLNSSSLFESPYYYLKQNDIIYIEPNKSKIAASDITQIRDISIATSIITLIIVIISRLR